MNAETIKQLKEYKQLLDEGVLSQEEFDAEKKKLLSAESSMSNEHDVPAIIEQQEVVEYETEQIIPSQSMSRPRNLPSVPLAQRMTVMQAQTPNELVEKYERRRKLSIIYAVIGGIFLILFFSEWSEGGFWNVLWAMIWALFPAILLGSIGLVGIDNNKKMAQKFKGMSQSDFEWLKEEIRERRAHEREVVGQIATEASRAYTQQTGGNMWFDIGKNLFSR